MTPNPKSPGCRSAILGLFGPRAGQSRSLRQQPSLQDLPFRTREDFLSPAELSFYHVLVLVLEGKAVVCPKVRLADVLFVARPNENIAWFNRIAPRHIDFLLCEPQTLRAIAGLELDDASHKKPARKESDQSLDEIFAAASLPLLRIPARRQYATSEVASSLAGLLPSVAAATPHAEPTAAPARGSVPEVTALAHPPLCPKCGIPMVVRIAGQGEHKGKRFYGCSNYPRCRQAIALDR